MQSGGYGRRHGVVVFGVGDGALGAHSRQHEVAAPERPFRAIDGIAGGWRLQYASQHGQLGNVQFSQGLAVVGAGCRLGAVGALPERHLVDVELQNLVLLKLRFDLQRQQHLLELAQEAPLQAE